MRLLFIGNDAGWMQPAAETLRLRGAPVAEVSSLADAEAALAVDACHAVVLDLLAVDGSVPVALAGLRRRSPDVPIVVLAACATVEARVRAIKAGADDCLSRPLSIDELLVRLEVWNRRRFGGGQPVIERGRLRFDVTHRAAMVDGQRLPLSRLQTDLLESLLLRAGRPLSKDQLLDELADRTRAPRINTLEVQISRLRKLLVPAQVGISAVRGVGYCLQPVHADAH